MKITGTKVSKRKEILTTDGHGWTRIKTGDFLSQPKKYPHLSVPICGFISLFLIAIFVYFDPANASAESADSEIEQAIFTRQEFFGAQAIIPLPTAEARENLAKLAEKAPDNPQILEKLGELNEKLSRFDEAETNLKRLTTIDSRKFENLAAFYNRRAQFEKEAEILKTILFSTAAENRAAAFERLIDAARRHGLKAYLQPTFYAEVARENPNLEEIFERLIGNLTEEKNYAEALNFVRQARAQFPARQKIFLAKEIAILLETDDSKEAEKVYQAAFDPLWSDAEAQKFYDFLSAQDRLRAYGAEIKARFRKNPSDFDAALRLALYRDHDYSYGNDDAAPIIAQLEAAKKSWTTDELVIVSRFLLQAGDAESASRFLYTLYLREDFKTNSAQRARVLYQLFEMFSDAENQRLPLVKGDLRFYEDVARADPNPGITTGILSLIFSDTDPREKLDAQETQANKLFNRAAAYRIYEEYKRENPNSNELAQMSLDFVRLYAAAKDLEIAERILNEFSGRFENSSDYPAAALKLADAYIAVDNEAKAREVFQKTLDYLGKQKKPLAPPEIEKANLASEESSAADFENMLIRTEPSAADFEDTPVRNEGINIPSEAKKPPTDDYYYEKPAAYRDYLGRKDAPIFYREVLEKLVASLVKEKKTPEILAVYSNEIAKYPDEQWLYEQRLTQLEQTNLLAEQLEVYEAALARFQTNGWRDKLARFFVRNDQNDEFVRLSEDAIGKLDDADARDFLTEFVDSKVAAGGFEQQLYFKLYQTAHARFPHNAAFTNGLLRFYKVNKQEDEWRRLAAEYYFESPPIREALLDDLAQKELLRDHLELAKSVDNPIYALFRADAAARLSNFENAVAAYRRLNELYPNTPEFSTRLINFTRSFGQKNSESLNEAAKLAVAEADFAPNSAEYRTRGGEILAELGDYEKARYQWGKIVETAAGDKETYLDAATVYWDYFQYSDALAAIKNLRGKFGDETLYAFETGAIYEAQHRQNEAVGEYVKAFDAKRDERQKEKAVSRLANLAARAKRGANENKTSADQFEKIVGAAFAAERARRGDAAFLALGYAEFLVENKQTDTAENVLNEAVRQSANQEFLEAARDFYQSKNNAAGEQVALQKLAETSANARQAISYRLQLAESQTENQQREAAKTTLDRLVRQFPTNYGVLMETASFYQRLGYENESAQVLENALPKSRGVYRNALAGKLAARLIQLNRLAAAEAILTNLHESDKANTEIFGELARVYVRTNKPEAMRKAFAETVAELKKSETERRELEPQIADLRTRMIDAFTKLKDYEAAIEQHTEIINREPENEELTENAISYVQRYGGAEKLVGYYEKLSVEAFKNYRWNVVLARIYTANKNFDAALINYRAAIVNQPEMAELHLAIADLETPRGNFAEALQSIDEALELTGDDAEYVKKKIEILKKAGRFAEIETEKAKLPPVEEKKITVNQFAEAQKTAATEKEKAREMYRAAFAALDENPLSGELKTVDIACYVQSLRGEEPLDRIAERLWILRGKLIDAADESNSTGAGAARSRLSTLDGALVETVGATARNVGTDEELKNLHEDWRQKIENNFAASNRYQTAALMQNLSRRAGFGDLEEMILRKRLDADTYSLDERDNLRALVNFYRERGAYQKTFDLLEQHDSDDLALRAEMAKVVGNREKELAALRAIYWKTSDSDTAPHNENVTQFLEILRVENPSELKSVTEKNSVYQLQLINFLLGKGDRELAHAAIENSDFQEAWKVARHAETSLALREFDADSECYFCDALQFYSIGEMVAQTPDKQRFLINDDWFRLTREYGEWLIEKKDLAGKPSKYTTAMIENQPNNADEQYKLGVFYLEKGELQSAVEHLRLAFETNALAFDSAKAATLGAAYFKMGEVAKAEKWWTRISENATVENGAALFEVLNKYGLKDQARAKLPPIIVKFLETNNADGSDSAASFEKLIRAVAASFDDERQKSAYFQAILRKRPTDVSLAAMLVNENLIGESEQKDFYEMLIARSDELTDSDYKFTPVAGRAWAREDSEAIYEQENEYKIVEPENEQYEWRKRYVEVLINSRDDARAERLIADIEKSLQNRYARPAWLRLAKIRWQIRANKFDETEIRRFIGITASDAAAEINPPNVERFNDVARILNEENRGAEIIKLSESYFARALALEQYTAANFSGLARAYFQQNEREKALQILQLMIDVSDAATRETALAAVAAIDAVKIHSANAAKIASVENSFGIPANTLRIAAEIAAEFGQIDAAIAFRRQLLDANSADAINRLELAKILIAENENTAAESLLTPVINEANAARGVRWQARQLLNAEMPNVAFDMFSQYYNGIRAGKNNNYEAAIEFYINALIADHGAETTARQELMKAYAAADKPFAALQLAATDKSAKPDELLAALAAAAEKIGDYGKAVEYENARLVPNIERTIGWQKLADEANRKATDFAVDSKNTRNL